MGAEHATLWLRHGVHEVLAHGTPGQVAGSQVSEVRPNGTPGQAGAGWGTLRIFPVILVRKTRITVD
jgi:hypothetical protein